GPAIQQAESDKVDETKKREEKQAKRYDPTKLFHPTPRDPTDPFPVSLSWHFPALEEGPKLRLDDFALIESPQAFRTELNAEVVLRIQRNVILQQRKDRQARAPRVNLQPGPAADKLQLGDRSGNIVGQKSGHCAGIENKSQQEADDGHLDVHPGGRDRTIVSYVGT